MILGEIFRGKERSVRCWKYCIFHEAAL